jgi:hypothetical protein
MRRLPGLKFRLDQFRGNIGEDCLQRMLEQQGYRVVRAPNKNFPAYDMTAYKGTNVFTVENKHDFYYDKTGNLCFEFDGLDHSKADWFSIMGGDPIKCHYWMPLESARVFAHKWADVRQVGERHDGKPNMGAIIPEREVMRIPGVLKLKVFPNLFYARSEEAKAA